ncbi:hypothetical protein IKB17_05630 [bacterium]|nr:hypothetical protein [bacterium]
MENLKNLTKNKHFILFLLAIFSIFLACLSKDYDYDLYARLIVGEHFFKTGWIAYEDFLSYTPTHLWFDHEWGASLFFYAFLKLFGNFGLILIYAILMFLTSFFIIKTQQLQKHAYPTSLAFMSVFLIIFFHQNPSIVRCHMFSFMFFSMLIYFLEKTRIKNSNILWLMPLITVIWNNIHGGVVSGLGIIFIYLVGEILSKKHWLKYFLVLLISTPLLAINPYGVSYLEFLISANTKNRYYITEWWDVFAMRHVRYYYPQFFVSIFTVFFILTKFIENKKLEITKFLVLLVTTLLGTIHVKLLSLPIIILASLYYNDIMHLFNKNFIKFLNKLAVVIITFSILYIPLTNPTIARTDLKKYPVKEVEFLKINNIKGNIATLFGLGSYVSYKLYPNNLIYMDGRYEEVYDDEIFNDLISFETANKNWDNILKFYPTNILMPEIKSKIYKHLKSNSKDWIEVYSGECVGIFLPKQKINKNKKLLIPNDDINYYRQREFLNNGKFGE